MHFLPSPQLKGCWWFWSLTRQYVQTLQLKRLIYVNQLRAVLLYDSPRILHRQAQISITHTPLLLLLCPPSPRWSSTRLFRSRAAAEIIMSILAAPHSSFHLCSESGLRCFLSNRWNPPPPRRPSTAAALRNNTQPSTAFSPPFFLFLSPEQS